MVLYSLGSRVTAFALSSEHSRMLPRRAIETQTAVRSTITRVGIKEKMVCCGVKGAYRRWMGEWQKKKATVRMWTGLSGIKWKTVFYMTVEGGTACLLFVGVVGWFVWMVVCSLGSPHTLHCLGLSAGAGLLHYKSVGFYDASLTVMLMNALLAFTSPVSLWKWQAVYSPLPFSLKRPLHPSPPAGVVLMFNSLIRKGSGCFS